MEKYIALVTIIKEGSFTKASEKLGYTQSALSQMISSLEKELGVTLLIRSHFGAKLSPDGKILFPIIAQAVKSYQSILDKSQEIIGLENTTINLSCFSSVAVNCIPSLIAEFRKLYPNIQFSIDIVDDEYSLYSLSEGASDLAFIAATNAPNLKYVKLFEEEQKAILPKGHPLSEKDEIPLEELLREPFLINSFTEKGDPNLNFYQSLGIEPNVILRMENNVSIMDMVGKGVGVSIVPDMSLSQNHYDIEVRRTIPTMKRSVYLAYRSKRSMPYAAVRFMNFIIEQTKQMNFE